MRALKGKAEAEAVYGITGLKRGEADAGELLRLARGHWAIESGRHDVRDVTPGEDACRVRTGGAPQAPAALRNAVVHPLHGVEAASKAAATRRFAAHPFEALGLLPTWP